MRPINRLQLIIILLADELKLATQRSSRRHRRRNRLRLLLQPSVIVIAASASTAAVTSTITVTITLRVCCRLRTRNRHWILIIGSWRHKSIDWTKKLCLFFNCSCTSVKCLNQNGFETCPSCASWFGCLLGNQTWWVAWLLLGPLRILMNGELHFGERHFVN